MSQSPESVTIAFLKSKLVELFGDWLDRGGGIEAVGKTFLVASTLKLIKA